MKIEVETLIVGGETKIITHVDFDLENVTLGEIAMTISELEKIKKELLDIWAQITEFEINKLAREEGENYDKNS